MNKIELINRHAEMVGGIKTSFALQDDMVESNIFLPHLGEVRVCEGASNVIEGFDGKKRPSECCSNVIMPTSCTLTKSDSKVRENAGNATIFLPHLGEVRLVLLRGDVC